MGVSMSTLMGWIAVLGIFGGYSFREWSRQRQGQIARAGPRQRQERQTPNPRKEPKEPKENKGRRTRADDVPHSAKAPAAAPAAPQRTAAYNDSSDDDAASNREFARQLASVKQGTKFTAKTKDETRKKSVKQSHAEEVPVADAVHVSAPSSTAGIDADDDRSSAASPVIAAADAGNVDDMLEKPAPGPSVLRLTGTEEKTSGKAKKTKPEPAPVETKRQRQNRKKAELAKAIREESEKERKVKMEAQRRLARESEGRAAKDGSAFMAAQASQSNAWKSNGTSSSNGTNGVAKPATSTSAGANGFVPVQPLDTFDSNAVQTDVVKSSAPSLDKNDDWMSSLPSEEEQMEMLRKGEKDEWNTVKTKSRKAKNKENLAKSDVASTVTAPVAAAAPATTVDKSRPGKVFQQKSSFAALSTDTPGDDEEHEWDV